MPDKVQTPDVPAAPADAAPVTPPTPPRRGPGHRGADVRDTVAEMAARAQEISQEAGSKMAAAMKDVIGAAAGLAGFAIESARDLVQYMVRRGQMTQEEADKLIREAEEANSKRKPMTYPPRASALAEAARKPAPFVARSAPVVVAPARPMAAPIATPAKAAVKLVSKPAAKKPAAKTPAPKKPTAKKKPAAKKSAKPAPKPAPKRKAKPVAKKKKR